MFSFRRSKSFGIHNEKLICQQFAKILFHNKIEQELLALGLRFNDLEQQELIRETLTTKCRCQMHF